MPTTSERPLPRTSSLEAEVASLLNDLLAGQGELMAVLNRKRNLLGGPWTAKAWPPSPTMSSGMLGVLQDCLTRRQALLARAAGEGLPSASIQALTNALPPPHRAAAGPASRRGGLPGEIAANPKPY